MQAPQLIWAIVKFEYLMSNVTEIIPRVHLSTVLYLKSFCQFSIPFTFDGAYMYLLHRSFGAWPEIAKLIFFSGPCQRQTIRLQYAATSDYDNVGNSTKLDLAWLKGRFTH